jgi:uncharacterized protein (DUF2336 family)
MRTGLKHEAVRPSRKKLNMHDANTSKEIARNNCRHLLQLAQDTTPHGRHKLANEVSLLFENDKLNDAEHHLVVDIMTQLIHRAELDLREALSERLSALPNIPAEMAIFLANDSISVARPMLQNSPVLNDADLIFVILSKGSEYWQSIAKRHHLSPNVIGRLVGTGDAMTATTLISNTNIPLQKDIIKKIIGISISHKDMQASILQRKEIDSDLAACLYACAAENLRGAISIKFSFSSSAVEDALNGLVQEFSREAHGKQHIPPEMLVLAKSLREKGDIYPSLMIKVLRRGQTSFFIALFAEQAHMSPENVVSLITQDKGKPFALACRKLGMMRSEFATIYLLSQSLRTQEKIVSQEDLGEALECFLATK